MPKKKKVETIEISVPMKDVIIPMYKDVFKDVLAHKHTHYTFKGGRGSTKSSFISSLFCKIIALSIFIAIYIIIQIFISFHRHEKENKNMCKNNYY